MRIHTDTLTVTDIYAAAAHAGGGDYRTSPVYVDVMEHGSRKRARAFNVSLTGTSTRRPNSGNRGADGADVYAATWDEWGMFLAELFRRDPNATIPGVYESGEHFRWVTGGRFDTLTPADQHGGAGHKWSGHYPNVTGVYYVAECTGRKGLHCDATTRYMASGHTFAEISGQSFAELEGV